jgi:hypothetical protein
MAAPCGWVVDRCGCGSCWDGYTPETRTRAATLAAGFLWAATGRRYGLCEVTVLPENPPRPAPLYQSFPSGARYGYGSSPDGLVTYPVLDSGTWRNLGGGGGCCGRPCELALPGPVADVVEIRIDGDPVPADAYEVHNGALLVRVDGQCWPICQRMGSPVAGFQVTYHRGTPIPPDVQAALEQLACEYAKACAGAPCGLPPRLASISLQGVELTVAEVDSTGGRLRTGIKAVDDVIDAVNPYGLTERPQVWSPDQPDDRVVTWRAGS